MCNAAGSAPKAVDVRTENATVDGAHLDAFCIKDKGREKHTQTQIHAPNISTSVLEEL